jgi:hypothetical protein
MWNFHGFVQVVVHSFKRSDLAKMLCCKNTGVNKQYQTAPKIRMKQTQYPGGCQNPHETKKHKKWTSKSEVTRLNNNENYFTSITPHP